MRKMNAVLVLLLLPAALFAAGRSESAEVDYRDPAVLERLIEKGSHEYILIDVRTPTEYSSGHIPTAINIPVDVISSMPPEAKNDDLIIVYCRSGNRSAVAKGILEDLGFTNIVDFGGINRYPSELSYPAR